MKNKIIIPRLINLRTDTSKILNLEICPYLDFFHSKERSKRIYTVIHETKNTFKEKGYFGNFVYSYNNEIIYKKKILGMNIGFRYNILENTFYYNRLGLYIPFQI